MKKQILSLIILLIGINSIAQISNLQEKYVLPQTLEEGSGILFYNDKLISFNDSENLPNLYELDTITNQITRTIQITNVTNTDWEDIAQDDNYIYIGDFGNNLGDRTDLKIYRIDKTTYLSNTRVNAFNFKKK